MAYTRYPFLSSFRTLFISTTIYTFYDKNDKVTCGKKVEALQQDNGKIIKANFKTKIYVPEEHFYCKNGENYGQKWQNLY